MKKFLFSAMIMTLFLGCESKVESTDLQVNEQEVLSPTHIATFEVEGMMCQKGCGAVIRKGLYDTGGVSEVEINFEEDRPVNEIKVYFDIKRTSTDKMISVIRTLDENRYAAKLRGVTESTISAFHIDNQVSEKPKKASFNDISSPKVSSETFTFPNLTKLLNGLIN